MMNAPEPHPGILKITPYQTSDTTIPGFERVIRLDSNENAFGASPAAIDAYRDAAHALNRYPEPTCQRLRGRLAEKHELTMDQIVCGAGSEELLGLLCHAFAGRGDDIVYSEYGFIMYPIYALASGAKPVAAAELNFRTNVKNVLASVTSSCRIVFIANPNNPTGTYLSWDEIEELHERLPEGVLLVLDEAYAEYVDREDYGTALSLVDKSSNIVVLRTFSKIYGLAGVRLGWAYCPPSIADVLNRVRAPFNVCAPAQAAGLAALEDDGFLEQTRNHNRIWLPKTIRELERLGLQVPSAVANFVLAGLPQKDGRDASAAISFLRTKGIVVRGIQPYGLDSHVRITIGRDQEMNALFDALREFVS